MQVTSRGPSETLLFRGAGPGALSGNPWHRLDSLTREVTSWPGKELSDLAFPRSDSRGHRLFGTRGFGSRVQAVVSADIRGRPLRTYGTGTGRAILFPTPNNDETLIAALVVTGRTDRPPSGAPVATLSVMMPNPNLAVDSAAPFAASRDLVQGVPAAPIDWSENGSRIFYTARDGDRMFVHEYSLAMERIRIVGEGVFPRLSRDKTQLAHIDHRRIVVRKAADGAIIRMHDVEWAIGWIDWELTANSVTFVENGPVYRSRVSSLDVSTGKIRVLLETGIVDDIVWIAE